MMRIILIGSWIFTLVFASWAFSLEIKANQNCYLPGDELVLSASYDGGIEERVDVYVAFLLPGDDIIFWGSDGEHLVFTREPLPVVRGWIPTPFGDTPFFRYRVSGIEPPGGYKVVSAFLRSEEFSSDALLEYAEREFVLNRGIVSWSPEDGVVLDTIFPEFSFELCYGVDNVELLRHMRIKIESLLSGKWVEAYPDGEDFLVHAFLPGEVPGEETHIYKRYSLEDLEDMSFLRIEFSPNGKRFSFRIERYQTEFGEFSLHYGGSYKLSLEILEGLTDPEGREIPPGRVEINFSIAPLN